MIVGNCKKSSNEKGSAMVEMSIAMVFTVMVIGSVIDISLIMYRTMLLNHVTTVVTREVATMLSEPQVGPVQSCSNIQQEQKAFVNNSVLTRFFGIETAEFEILLNDARIVEGSPYWMVSVESNIHLNCMFCYFIAPDFESKFSSRSVVENDRFDCNLVEDSAET